jgi:signal peptidase I
MERTLHCAKPATGCLGTADDVVVARLNGAAHLRRFDIVVFEAPRKAALKCGEGGRFVKRIVGLPGDTVREDDHGFIWIRRAGAKKFFRLDEPHLSASQRLADSARFGEVWHVPQGESFTLGDNRTNSATGAAGRGWPLSFARLLR